jgi:hypothetical protein
MPRSFVVADPDTGEILPTSGLKLLPPLTSRAERRNFVSLFKIRREYTFDPFHECADSARQIAPMCYDEGHGERPATKIGYDLHKRSTL